jgi:hypothetical protein
VRHYEKNRAALQASTPAWLLPVAILVLCASAGAALAACQGGASARRVSGQWEGIITGRELAQSAHLIDVRVALSIRPDGSWEMSTELGHSAGGVTSVVGD